jgi:hypothetical protein
LVCFHLKFHGGSFYFHFEPRKSLLEIREWDDYTCSNEMNSGPGERLPGVSYEHKSAYEIVRGPECVGGGSHSGTGGDYLVPITVQEASGAVRFEER